MRPVRIAWATAAEVEAIHLEDAFHRIGRALGSRGAQVWVEDPGHVGARRILQREGLKVAPVPVDAEGLDVAAGRRLAPRARFALVTPSRQFPSGAALSLSRRVALIDWAHENDAVIIADDYDSELRFAGRPMAALSSLDSSEAVLSIGSFSKITFPGLRLGYVVGPRSLIAQLVKARARRGPGRHRGSAGPGRVHRWRRSGQAPAHASPADGTKAGGARRGAWGAAGDGGDHPAAGSGHAPGGRPEPRVGEPAFGRRDCSLRRHAWPQS
ncbi:aminotransferase class I/II-fold pyridoxal phosphate-dependent enzyme [Phenylobacterium sp. LjRoot225]|uniref:aminotransferase class I/II-fold pyridoxal phosphate-dependent enzyme n=1 Tax=Phenylobacterium sp. LjRoot225 TaxID=3342285 RepID=UPI003F4FFBA7